MQLQSRIPAHLKRKRPQRQNSVTTLLIVIICFCHNTDIPATKIATTVPNPVALCLYLPLSLLRSDSLRYLWLLKRSGKQKQPASSKLLSLPLFSSIDLSSSLLIFLPKLPSSHFSPSPNQWGAASIHQTRRHLPCIPCKSSHPHLLIKEASAATNQVQRSDYVDQDVCVHTDSALMRSLSGYLLFGHSATDPFNSGTLPSTDSGTGWHFLPECHYYSPQMITIK